MATDIIDYVATDQTGLTATSARTPLAAFSSAPATDTRSIAQPRIKVDANLPKSVTSTNTRIRDLTVQYS